MRYDDDPPFWTIRTVLVLVAQLAAFFGLPLLIAYVLTQVTGWDPFWYSVAASFWTSFIVMALMGRK